MMKKRIVWMVMLTLLLLVLAPEGLAAAEVCQVSFSATLNGEPLLHDGAYNVSGREEIQVKAASLAGIDMIGYYFSYRGVDEEITDVHSDEITITVPEHPAGEYIELYVEAVANNDDGTPNTVTKTGWYRFTLLYSDYSAPVHMTVTCNGEAWMEEETYAVSPGDTVHVEASCEDGIAFIGYFYFFDDEKTEITDEYDDEMDIVIPEKGDAQEVWLCIDAVAPTDAKTGWQMYCLQYE